MALGSNHPTTSPASTITSGAPSSQRSRRFAASDLTTIANAAASNSEFMGLIPARVSKEDIRRRCSGRTDSGHSPKPGRPAVRTPGHERISVR